MMDATSFLQSRRDFLFPAILVPEFGCLRCRGAKKSNQYDICYQCGQASEEAFPEHLGFGIYNFEDEQSAAVMARYKSENVDGSSLKSIIRALANLGIKEALDKFDVDLITTIPSLSGRKGPHPLLLLVQQTAETIPDCPPVSEVLLPTGRAMRNEVSEKSFTSCISGEGFNVLVIDDTYTSGNHMRSATLRLRKAGAAKVYGLALARRVGKAQGFGNSEVRRFAKEHRPSFADYEFFDSQPTQVQLAPWL
ncbi:hypothetical protein PAB09_11410 [Corynebacterium sp. SCR221107]|uniref:ComF family protein n=1 Tax=Corynebacterium sp. SCR221107 TaxID=3017361 RepID=UPI0022EC9093|nr:hypothetical protein [Corynebacterium sp. SCR221107]WBT08461.1 hypothetical protein PAB09_11410 [Corynebacterium sp. SCR221107]